MKKADISINLIFVITITVISIILLSVFVIQNMPRLSKGLYCFLGQKFSVEECGTNPVEVIPIRPEVLNLRDFIYRGYPLRTVRLFASDNLTIRLPKSTIIEAGFFVRTLTPVSAIYTSPLTLNLPYSGTSVLYYNTTWHTNESLLNCSSDPCDINLEVTFSEANITLFDLNVEYESCQILESILASSIDCWDLARSGSYNKDIICYELVLSPSCLNKSITHQQVLNYLQENSLCDILQMDPPNCGHAKNFEWKLSSPAPPDILVEYDESDKLIRVS